MRVAEKLADPNVDEDLYVDIVDHLGFTSSKIGTILSQFNDRLLNINLKSIGSIN